MGYVLSNVAHCANEGMDVPLIRIVKMSGAKKNFIEDSFRRARQSRGPLFFGERFSIKSGHQ
jgi:hypothetical protein